MPGVHFNTMKKYIALVLISLFTCVSTAFASSYSTEAIMTRQKDKDTYTVVIRVSRLIEQDGRLTEQLIAQPRIISKPGRPATMSQGSQAPDPNFQKQENVSVDVAWPEAGKAGLALCTVVVKLGDKTVSKSKLQVTVGEP
jgi:hypothetical protein